MGLFGSKSTSETLATDIPVPSPPLSSDVSVVVSPHVPSTPMRRSSRRPKSNIVTPLPVTPSPARQHHSSLSKRPKQDISPDVSLSSSGSVNPNKRQKLSSTSFGAITHATFQKKHEMEGAPAAVPVHTLILGTHPGLQSLKISQYYGHPMNVFWWIAGDCLGFRRGSGRAVGEDGRLYKFASELRYGPEEILEHYEDQVERLTQHGFALWDVVHSCQRRKSSSSMDTNLYQDSPNAIREFCQEHRSTMKRIVLANGSSGFSFFRKHFREWLDSTELYVLEEKETEEDYYNHHYFFDDVVLQGPTNHDPAAAAAAAAPPTRQRRRPLFVVPAISVSPAAALHSYAEKRDFWERFVYQPGLKNYKQNQAAAAAVAAALPPMKTPL